LEMSILLHIFAFMKQYLRPSQQHSLPSYLGGEGIFVFDYS
jgi:hypothetical protein